MYSKPTCPYCKMAKEALKKFVGTDNLPADQYEVVEISGDPDMNEIQDYLNKITGGRSVCTKDFLFNPYPSEKNRVCNIAQSHCEFLSNKTMVLCQI